MGVYVRERVGRAGVRVCRRAGVSLCRQNYILDGIKIEKERGHALHLEANGVVTVRVFGARGLGVDDGSFHHGDVREFVRAEPVCNEVKIVELFFLAPHLRLHVWQNGCIHLLRKILFHERHSLNVVSMLGEATVVNKVVFDAVVRPGVAATVGLGLGKDRTGARRRF